MSNPLLDDVKNSGTVETVSIALPTMGRFYEDDVLDGEADPGDLVINSLGIMAELSTRDPFILASGKGMELLIPQICPAIQQPSKLAEIDLEAILLAARIATHGNKMTLEHKCPNPVQAEGEKEVLCGEENKIEVNLYDIIQRYGPIEFSDKFVVDLPEYNQKVYLRPIEYGQALTLLKEALATSKETEDMSTTKVAELLTNDNKIDEYSTMIAKQAVSTMESIIHSIFYVEAGNGGKVFDRDSIKEWLLAIAKENVKKIVKQAGELSESFYGNNSITYKCAGCGKENKTSIELDIQKLFFFYSARFKSAEEAFKYIESEKAAKDNTIKNLAKISHAYEGAISYHKLKEAPAREISLILEAIEEIRKDQEKQMKSAQSGNKNQTTIGFENP